MRKRQAFVCSNCEASFSEKPAPSTQRGRVFLSYGHDPISSRLATRLQKDLENIGWKTWVDRTHIKVGHDWRQQISTGILESQHVLALLSEHSTRKPGVCRQEIAIALGPNRGNVYTILVEPLNRVTPPLLISHLQWLDLQDWGDLCDQDPSAAEDLYLRGLSEIGEALDRNASFSGDIDTLREWLKPWDSIADLVSNEHEFVGRRWLLDGLVDDEIYNPEQTGNSVGEIEQWRLQADGPKMFWLSAGPGWGKSAIVARLAHSAKSVVVAIHVCRYDQQSTLAAKTVVHSLAFQMATQLGDYREHLLALARDGIILESMNASELFGRLIANPLARGIGGVDSSQGRRLIVIDALDESIEFGQSELVQLISSEFAKLPPWLGLVVTSRPEAAVARQLGSFGIRHQSEEDPRNRDDLEEYAIAWLTSLPSLRNSIDLALGNVLDSSAGMFLYLRKLQEAVTNGVICESDLIIESTLPKGLGALYERWFLKRFPSQSDYAEHYRPLFEVVLSACEPLPIKFVRRVLDWGPYDESKLVSPMSAFFHLDNEAITVFHKSLGDWLINSSQSGNFYANPQEGDFRLARVLSEMFSRDQCLSMAWPRYLLQYGAIHATRAHSPGLGAAFLYAQTRSEADARLEVGALRLAIDAYLGVLHESDSYAINSIKSRDLAQLISRTDTRSALTFACEELIARKSDWVDAFSSCPLDSRGATWVFAACWAKKVLRLHTEQALFELETIREIAVDARHPLNLPAAYAFKYIGLNKPEWLSSELLEPLCKSWTYSRLVATSLLQQLALKGVDLVSAIPWEEFWSPPWQYNRNELDLLGAALLWKGFDSPITPKQKTLSLMHILTETLKKELAEPFTQSVQKQALELFWLAGDDPEKCQSLLQSLDFSDRSSLILDLYLKSPIFEAVEVAAGVVANRLADTTGGLTDMTMRARPESHEAWGAFMAASKAAIALNNTELFFELVKRYADSTDPWCRGLAAQYLARWLRDTSEQSFINAVVTHESLLRKLLHDEDIWPVQEIFHLLQEFSASLQNHGINWRTRFQLNTASIVSTVTGWDEDDCDWAAFEASATFAAISKKAESRFKRQSD